MCFGEKQEILVAVVNYKVTVQSKSRLPNPPFSTSTEIVSQKLVTLDFQTGTKVSIVFSGFTLTLRPAGPPNQIEYQLTNPDHPLSDSFAIAFGGAHLDGNSDIRILDFTVPLSLDEKLQFHIERAL